MNLQMKIAREVSLSADRFYSEAEALGQTASQALGTRRRAQITQLESVANSALKVSDVLDYIKRQTAKEDDWRKKRFGPRLLSFVGDDLRQHRDGICNRLDLAGDSFEAQEVYLHLIREFVRQLAAHFEYATAGHAR